VQQPGNPACGAMLLAGTVRSAYIAGPAALSDAIDRDVAALALRRSNPMSSYRRS